MGRIKAKTTVKPVVFALQPCCKILFSFPRERYFPLPIKFSVQLLYAAVEPFHPVLPRQVPVFQDTHRVAHVFDHVEKVRGKENGIPLRRILLDAVDQCDRRAWIQPGHRLV